MKKSLFIVILLILGYLSAGAQIVKFNATASATTVSVGERIQVAFTLENTNGSNFKAPSFKGFSVLSGPSQSQSTSWINGQVSSSISYVYIIRADVEGKFTIEPAFITAGGKRYSSNSITITVVKGSAKPQAQSQAQAQQDKSLDQQADEILRKNIFIKLNVNKTSVYQGEQIVASYKLYVNSNLNITNLSVPKMPVFNGFWNQEINIGQQKFQREVVDGVTYNTLDLKKVVLLPQQSGNLNIEPMEVETIARLVVQGGRRSRSPFDDFFNDPFFNNSYKDFKYTAKSKSSVINVKPLPPNAPPEFKGGVGNFKINAWLDKNSTKTNEPVTLKVQVTGNGNLKLLEPFSLNLPPDIESYEPKIADNTNVTINGISGNKIFEYLLIPRHSGDYKIQPVKFAYFDLDSKKYVMLNTQEFNLKVEKGAGGESSTISGIQKEEIKYIGKDIRYIKNTGSSFSRRGSSFYHSAGFYIMTFLPFLLFILFFIYKKREEKEKGDIVLLKNKKANSVARKRLSTAKKYLEQSDKDKFYEEVSHALWGYLSDKLSIPYSDLTKDSASYAMEKRNISREIVTNYMKTIDNCEFERFAPASEQYPLEKIYNDAATAIADMEGNLR